jgi:hypothetical protein
LTPIDLSTSPWLIRIFDRVPLSLPAMGMLIALVHYLFIAALAHVLAPNLADAAYRLWQGELSILALQVTKSIMVGYVISAGYYGLREAVRDFESLRPALSCDDVEFEQRLVRLRRVPRVPLHAATALALFAGFMGPLDPAMWSLEPPPLGSARMSMSQIEAFLLAFITIRIIILELILATLFTSVARRFAIIELLDLERVAPFSRRALRAVLVFMLFITLQALQAMIDPHPSGVIEGLIITGVLAVAIFLIPLVPLQRHISAAKQSELARIRADIRCENEARIEGGGDWPRFTGLIAYEQRIERVSTWAFNTSTLLRFALYVSLGIGSWVGAAFVERWLGTLLGS